jgi:hypothetical protein
MTLNFALPRPMLGAVALSLLGLGAQPADAQSQSYTVDIRPELNGLDIKIEHVANTHMLVLNLTNNSPTRVRCNLHYDASPQTPFRTTRHIVPGQRETSVLRAQRRWFSVTVDVVCVPAPR